MFGSKLKSWMENYIGRPRKKVQPEAQKEKSKRNETGRVILESSESLAQSDAGISSSSMQVLSSSTTDYKEIYSSTTIESERSGMVQCQASVSLPSPESAYSTGYSTDGTSPGGTGPPEYYINIRTGKHYFPSPAPTPTSPQPNIAFSELRSARLPEGISSPPRPSRQAPISLGPGVPETSPPDPSLADTYSGVSTDFPSFNERPEREPGITSHRLNTLSTSVPTHFEIVSFSKSHHKKSSPKSQFAAFKLFSRSPKQEKTSVERAVAFELKKKSISPTKAKKWFKQSFHRLGHRRTDSGDANDAKKEFYFEKGGRYLYGQESSASPRQRNRIKTNPWLPTEPISSQNFPGVRLHFSSRNRSCSNTPLQDRKANETDSSQNLTKWSEAITFEGSKVHSNGSGRQPIGKLPPEPSDHSEEDLTLNEMMGTFNESYVYEKETDILSDSDPTDCEDYGTDSEAENGGDERDSHDDELDFIDNGSMTENDDVVPQNMGKCTYHDVRVNKNSFLVKSDRRHSRKDSAFRRSLRKSQDSKGRRERRRHGRKSFACEEQEGKKILEARTKVAIDENVGGVSLRKVLLQRMMAKNVSKSAEGTPVTSRRQHPERELRETHIGNEKARPDEEKRGANFVLMDQEADDRYKRLIREAENIFESMRSDPSVRSRRKIEEVSDENRWKSCRKDRKAESSDVRKKVGPSNRPQCGPKHSEAPPKKSPKTLVLELALGSSGNMNGFDSETKKTSFKARSSAHSPLDPLGPTFRNFAVFEPTLDPPDGASSTSSSDDSRPPKPFDVVPVAFQSVDLGKPLNRYCPQSEPVKRKIYSCSKTYDKLVKQLERAPEAFDRGPGHVGGDSGAPPRRQRPLHSRSSPRKTPRPS